ncbi:MAG: SMC-Scp complex subunit ScpB [Deltaproteobacteria bacterium]|nr:SMC-Scp complex subunit ScpB [Deltaproteobacteria bacterium]
MDKEGLKPLIEALIFTSEGPLTFDRLAGVLEGEKREEIREVLKELIEDYNGGKRGFYIEEVAGGYQLRTRPELSPWLKRLFKIGMQKMSKASLETLAVIAYKQPVTRAELEGIRGVDSAGVLSTLLERRLVRIAGRKDEPGRPIVYGTTKEFLETFNLKDLASLPTLKEIETLKEGMEEEYDALKASEDNSPGRVRLQKEGRGDDTGGEGSGQQEGS